MEIGPGGSPSLGVAHARRQAPSEREEAHSELTEASFYA